MMQKDKKILVIILIMTTVLIIGLFMWGNAVKKHDQEIIVRNKSAVTQTLSPYTSAEVSAHNNTTSCWSIIDGYIYDLTQFINLHPGGEKAVFETCGIDGSIAFKGAHNGSARKMVELQKYIVGILTN